ncbi:hypothetical protein ABZ682_24260 [Streptomyces griseoviridis]|uniref:hypothetical protein n=1 Tax=Streptomyces TaxID=1883 RepID=UPI002474D6BC|nr:hypothetical protein [Streptomyces sp. MAA16]MDH6695994.1 hypothetical protein [Streptomyces sp. MAA16]
MLFRLAVVVLLGSGDLGVVGEDPSEEVVAGVAERPFLRGFLLVMGAGFGSRSPAGSRRGFPFAPGSRSDQAL